MHNDATQSLPESAPITRMADGTIKQVNPLSGTEVWTVPGRGHRPLRPATGESLPINHDEDGRHCAFCPGNYRQTPPEKARIVRTDEGWETLIALPATKLDDTVAEFRRIPNLFEILSLEYWQANYDYEIPRAVLDRRDSYLLEEEGWDHVLSMIRTKLLASGLTAQEIEALPERDLIGYADAFFASGHDVIVARRHFEDGATTTDQLAGSASLTPEEHAYYVLMTVEGLRDLYRKYPRAQYVAAFQNWLRPAGASFDHLHKQLVTIDEYGAQAEREIAAVSADPQIYNRLAVDYAIAHGLVLAENEHAIAFAGFGHRFPTLEVFSKASANLPWRHHPEAVRGMSDLIHACHVATGTQIATNEEWYYRPPGIDVAMPFRVLVKWRVSTLAGFEGGTKINVNTIDPYQLARRATAALLENRSRLADGILVGAECTPQVGCLNYVADRDLK